MKVTLTGATGFVGKALVRALLLEDHEIAVLTRDPARAREALPGGGRLVANAVTLDSEALLIALHAELGGELTRLSVERAAPIGGLTGGRAGWRPAMPVVQWSLIT